MKFWRKKSQGFDWHKYVRTTIKLRREQRRQKIEEIGRVAAVQAKAAGDAAVKGVAVAANGGWRAAVAGWRSTVAQPSISLPITFCGGIALFSGLYRWIAVAADRDAAIPFVIGFVLILLVAPLAFSQWPQRWPTLPAFDAMGLPSYALPAGIAAIAMLGLGWIGFGHLGAGLSTTLAPGRAASSKDVTNVLEGRATVLSGEMIRLQGRLLHLSGIEAPDRRQTCTRPTRQSWNCGEAALAALERLARAKTFRCITQGTANAMGRTEASCSADGRDVAGELVKDGHVFSTATYFGGYAALESTARRSGAGLWSGDADRPADFRSKLWEAARAASPDGCPVKGQVGNGRKTYLVPWDSGYAAATMRPSRGDRWLCTEAEAQSAGFKPSTHVSAK